MKNFLVRIVRHTPVAIMAFPFVAFCICVFLFWPGLMRPDSLVQMQQGIAGACSDFHPPMMGFVWGLFDKLYSGSGPMFLFHLVLYWGGVSLFAFAQPHKAKWVYGIAVFPPVFAYQLLVIKDISFVNAYLFCASWLHFYSVRNLRPKLLSLLVWFVIAFYGTCVAYQAIVVLPWLCLWFANLYWPSRSKKLIVIGLMISAGMTIAMEVFNRTMSTPSHRSQYIKLYDLAGISINLNKPVFPEYIGKNKFYDFERVKKLYSPNRVDDLTFSNDSPLSMAESFDQFQSLHNAWIQAIFTYPFAYLKHRWAIFSQLLTVSFLKHAADIKGETTPIINTLLKWAENTGLFSFASWLMAYFIYFLGQLYYLYKGCKCFKEHPRYNSLFFQSAMSLTLIFALFFVANAAEARYAYLAIAMFHFSHLHLFK